MLISMRADNDDNNDDDDDDDDGDDDEMVTQTIQSSFQLVPFFIFLVCKSQYVNVF